MDETVETPDLPIALVVGQERVELADKVFIAKKHPAPKAKADQDPGRRIHYKDGRLSCAWKRTGQNPINSKQFRYGTQAGSGQITGPGPIIEVSKAT